MKMFKNRVSLIGVCLLFLSCKPVHQVVEKERDHYEVVFKSQIGGKKEKSNQVIKNYEEFNALITALNIASKYEEIYTPDLKNLLRIGNLADARESVLKMETLVLTCLQFDITFPSVYRFIERFARLAQFS